jgi:hypothetical protein
MRFFILFNLVIMLGLAVIARADNMSVTANPYTPIVVRNIFSLIPMPTNPPPDEKPLDPPSKITPNGIMSLFGQLQVLFKVAQPAKGGKPAQDQSYVMSEGERQDDIEVTKIDEQAGMITFNNHGVVQELPLASTPNLSTPAAPVGGAGNSGFVPSSAPRLSPNGDGGTRFNRDRFGAGNRNGNNPTGNSSAFGGNPNNNAPPSFGGAVSGGVNNSQSQEAITPEAAVIMMEAQRAQWQQEGNPAAAIIPPTPLTQQLKDEPGGSPPTPP